MMTQLREHLQQRGEIEARSRVRIHPMRDGVQLALRIPQQVRAFGQVLAQQPVVFSFDPALPGKHPSPSEPEVLPLELELKPL